MGAKTSKQIAPASKVVKVVSSAGVVSIINNTGVVTFPDIVVAPSDDIDINLNEQNNNLDTADVIYFRREPDSSPIILKKNKDVKYNRCYTIYYKKHDEFESLLITNIKHFIDKGVDINNMLIICMNKQMSLGDFCIHHYNSTFITLIGVLEFLVKNKYDWSYYGKWSFGFKPHLRVHLQFFIDNINIPTHQFITDVIKVIISNQNFDLIRDLLNKCDISKYYNLFEERINTNLTCHILCLCLAKGYKMTPYHLGCLLSTSRNFLQVLVETSPQKIIDNHICKNCDWFFDKICENCEDKKLFEILGEKYVDIGYNY